MLAHGSFLCGEEIRLIALLIPALVTSYRLAWYWLTWQVKSQD